MWLKEIQQALPEMEDTSQKAGVGTTADIRRGSLYMIRKILIT